MVCRPAEGVCSLLCHGVDGGTHEVAVLHVEGGVDYLDILQCLKSEGSACSRHLLTVETHVGVEVGTIHTVVVHTAVTSAERTTTNIIR